MVVIKAIAMNVIIIINAIVINGERGIGFFDKISTLFLVSVSFSSLFFSK